MRNDLPITGLVVFVYESEDGLELAVEVDEYRDKLVEYCLVKIYCVARVIDTHQAGPRQCDLTPELH